MKLSDLLKLPNGIDDFDVTDVVEDSRMVKRGDVFVFDVRLAKDAAAYVAMAREKGAAVIVSNVEMKGVIYQPFPGDVLAKWAGAKWPRQPKNLVAVTGTNGKTSVAWFYAQLMQAVGEKSASFGTLGLFVNGAKQAETGYTSPTALKLHPLLEGLAQKGVTHVCLEASSQALDLHRLEGCRFKAAALTNITQDHLDYHGTMEAYAAAKYRLFSELLPEDGAAVINIQRAESWPLAALCKERGVRLISYGSGNAELVVEPIEMRADGQRLRVAFGETSFEVDVALVGAFQAQNVAAAVGLALATGAKIDDLKGVIAGLQSVPGRMEVMPRRENQPVVLVDYAHTPDGLENALRAVKDFCTGKLWCVFGCGGDRDATKRPLMGAIAAKLADEVIVTDDNPRTEDAAAIRQEILAAAEGAMEMGDRAAAIAYAITHAAAEDVVLLAGKGHESGQIVGGTVHPFDDRDVAKAVLKS